MNKLLQSLTKAELHIHIEGSLEPEMMFELAQRNKIALPYNNVAEIRKAYQFTNLQSFLDLYYRGMGVLQTEQDFYDLMFAYLKKVTSQNVSKVEIFFDPQGHTSRNVKWNTFMQGFKRAINDAKVNLNIDANLIMCFLRHLPESDAITTFEEAMNYRDLFIGVGLDSSEVGYPPSLFKQVFKLARDAGLYLVAHAGEEGDANYVWEAIDELGVHRIDHGNNAINDLTLIKRIANDKLALTMCPLSNQRLQSVPDLSKHQLRKFMDYGVKVTINSDDPAYFGGYVNENYQALADALNLSTDEITTIAKNSLDACFV
ncbi:MAG: adenosine deaminase [Neisseriales bacterium]|nr:MAG: adenosine deaminase [Neisseriales bacterium]